MDIPETSHNFLKCSSTAERIAEPRKTCRTLQSSAFVTFRRPTWSSRQLRPMWHRASGRSLPLCRWQEGRCTFGERCNYAHGEAELRPLPPEGYEILERMEHRRMRQDVSTALPIAICYSVPASLALHSCFFNTVCCTRADLSVCSLKQLDHERSGFSASNQGLPVWQFSVSGV